MFEKGKEPWLDFDGRQARPRVDPGYVARRTIDAQLPVEPRELGERLFATGPQPYLLARSEQQLETRPHGLEAEQNGRGRNGKKHVT